MNTAPFFDFNHTLADGTYPYRLNAGGQTSVNGANPFYYEEYGNRADNKVDVIENLNANYKISKFFELDAKYGINYDTEDDHRVYLNQSQNLNAVDFNTYIGPGTITGGIRNYSYKTIFQNALVSAFFRTNFKDDFHLNVPITTSTQVAYDYRKNRYSEYDTQGLGLPSYPIYNLNQTGSQQALLDFVRPFITYGFLVNQTIDYGDYVGRREE